MAAADVQLLLLNKHVIIKQTEPYIFSKRRTTALKAFIDKKVLLNFQSLIY